MGAVRRRRGGGTEIRQPAPARAPQTRVVQVTPMGSMEEATGVRRRIERKETTFDEAGQGLPRTLIWQELPEGLRAALEGLRPGILMINGTRIWSS